MKRLQRMTDEGWKWVFCWGVQESKPVLTDDKSKALPSRAMWALDDLEYFKRKDPSGVYRLAEQLDTSDERSIYRSTPTTVLGEQDHD